MARIASTLAGAGLVLLLAAVPAAAEDEHGSASVDEVHVAAGTVVLDGAPYRVVDATRIEDQEGMELSLAEVPSVAGGASAQAAAAWFEAGDASAGGVRTLRLLRLTGSMPK